MPTLLEDLEKRFGASVLHTLAVDIGDLPAVEAATAAVIGSFGQIDVLINNAAIVGPNAKTWEYPPQAFMDVVHIGLVGTFFVSPLRDPAHDRAKLWPHRQL